MYRGMAMRGVSNALIKQDGGLKLRDESITAVALLAGNEVSGYFPEVEIHR